MSFLRSRVPRKAAAVLAFVIPIAGLSCGPGAPEVDKAALYTPESLAQELAFRYRALSPEAKKAPTRSRVRSQPKKSIAQLESAESRQTKGKSAETPTKKARTQDLDALLDEIEGKLNRIQGMSRSDACWKMSDTIANDRTLSDSDKSLLAEKIKELGG
jgi:hypothetical protein